jgi:hypothetical protein
VSRFTASISSQTALAAGTPSGTTFNGYFAALVAGASASYKLRRVMIGVRAGAAVPVSQQVTVGLYRQTVRVAGTGFSTQAGTNLEPRAAATAVTGLDYTTATTAGTTGPTITTATTLPQLTFNTQAYTSEVWDFDDALTCDQGTANGIAFVNLGNALPTSHLYVMTLTWEE